MEALLAPAWVIALATAGFMGAMAVVKIKGNGQGKNGSSVELRQHFQAQTTVLQAITITLTALTERLAQLPTREDMHVIAAQNLDGYRSALKDAALGLERTINRGAA